MGRRLVAWLGLLAAGCALPLTGLGDRDASLGDAQVGKDGGPDAGPGGMDAGSGDAGPVGPDGGPMDAGPGAVDAGPRIDFTGLDWMPPSDVVTDGPKDCDRELDPILTHDLRWLLISRFEGSCSGPRRFHVLEWNGGTPSWRAMVGPIHPDNTEHNGHASDGALGGMPGTVMLFHTIRGGGFGDRDLYVTFLTGDPPVAPMQTDFLNGLNTFGDDDGPTLTAAADRMLYTVNNRDVYEATGAPPLTWGTPQVVTSLGADTALDLAVSPDGRVLVYSDFSATGDRDLFVARRAEASASFGVGTPLPRGAGQINTDRDEWDAYIASNGDLLYTSRATTGGTQIPHLARALP